VERYQSCDEATPRLPRWRPAGTQTRLVGAVYLVADEVVLALIEGPDEQTVAATARALGWRVDRLTPANWIVFTTDGQE
jgi:hypothetical protein